MNSIVMTEGLRLAVLVEALLFVADEPVSVGRLAGALDVSPAQVEEALGELEAVLRERGLRLQRMGCLLYTSPSPRDS